MFNMAVTIQEKDEKESYFYYLRAYKIKKEVS